MIEITKSAPIKCAAAALAAAILLAGCSSVRKSSAAVDNSSSVGSQTLGSSADSSASSQDASSETSAESQPATDTTSQATVPGAETGVLSDIMTAAKAGKVIDCDYKVDQSVNIEDIEADWGKADQSEWVASAKGYYTTYSKRNLVFGSNKGGAVFEIRSFDPSIEAVTLSSAESAYGKPAYDTKSDGQEIIGYVVGSYKLLLVFPQPTQSVSDPKLDHYSVFNPAGTVNSMAGDPGRQW